MTDKKNKTYSHTKNQGGVKKAIQARKDAIKAAQDAANPSDAATSE